MINSQILSYVKKILETITCILLWISLRVWICLPYVFYFVTAVLMVVAGFFLNYVFELLYSYIFLFFSFFFFFFFDNFSHTILLGFIYLYICILLYIYTCIFVHCLSAGWTHSVIARSVRAPERNSVVVGWNPTQANLL